MTLFIDTSVWSLALRRDEDNNAPEIARLREAIQSREPIVTTGLVLQELLQGFRGPKARDAIVERFTALPMLIPDRDDHVAAAEIRNTCRKKGIQIGTIDALLIQLCIRHELTMLATDRDYDHAARHVSLKLWRPR